MKKFLAAVAAIVAILLFAILIAPNASALDSQNGSISVEYDIDGNFELSFPSSVDVGSDFKIAVSDYNLPSDKCLQFVADSLYGDGYIRLFNDEDIASGASEAESAYVDLALFADGTQISTSNKTLGYVYAQGGTVSLSTEYADSSSGKAGSYSGTINFCVNCVDQ